MTAPEKVASLSSTSGTTGNRKQFRIGISLVERRTSRFAHCKGKGFGELKSLIVPQLRPLPKATYQAFADSIGCKLIEASRDHGEFVGQVLTERPEGIITNPGRLLALAQSLGGRHRFKYVQAWHMKVKPEWVDPICDGLGDNFWSTYGISEVSTIAVGDADDLRDGITGTLIPDVEAKITEFGELAVKTPTMAEEYVTRRGAIPVLTDGWFLTGDYATLTEDRKLTVMGRIPKDEL